VNLELGKSGHHEGIAPYHGIGGVAVREMGNRHAVHPSPAVAGQQLAVPNEPLGVAREVPAMLFECSSRPGMKADR
jgi:hypothetical protein